MTYRNSIRSLLLLFPLALFASVNEPMRWEWQTGYRNDTLHWHLINPGDDSTLTYSERYRNLQFWENALAIRVIYRDIAVFVRGSGAFGSGTLRQRFSGLSYTSEEPQLYFSTGAWTADGWGYFGYSVNLTADRLYKVILVPFVGCSVNYEHLSRHGSHTAVGEGVGSDSYALQSSFPGPEKVCMYGPLLGGFFLIEPGGWMQMEVGYAYRRLHLRFQTKMETDLSLYTAGSLVSETPAVETLSVKDSANLGQAGWARMDAHLGKNWRLGLYGGVQYFVSRVLDASLKNKTNNTELSQKYKLRWTAVFGSITLSRTF